MRFFIASLLCLITSPAWADLQYDASKGTLPQDQGFVYSGDTNQNGTNPSPFVANGVLNATTTVGGQFWAVTTDSSIDFSRHVVLQATLKIDSSNYIPNIGTGTREGYYLGIRDQHGSYSVGLADNGFNINSIGTPNQALTPFPIAGQLHTYRLEIEAELASFYIDGTLVARNIPPQNHDFIGLDVVFGGSAGLSRSTSELTSFRYETQTPPPQIEVLTDRSSWEASTTGISATGFEGIAEQGNFVAFDNSAGLVINGAMFTGLMPPTGSTDPTNFYLRVVDPAYENPQLGPSFYNWNSGAILHGPPIPIGPQGEGGTNSHIHVALPAGSNSVGSDIMSFLNYASTFTIVVSTNNGNVAFDVNSADYPTRAFAGFIADTPIVSLDYYAQNGFPALDNFGFGSASPPPQCQFSLSPDAQLFSSQGGIGSFTVTTSAECGWTAVPSASWLTVLPASSSGTGKVQFTANSNTGAARSASISVGGILFNISQQSGFSCSYTITPAIASFDDTGGTVSVALNTSSGCSWSASSNAGWLQVSPSSGNGAANIFITAAANTSGPRSSTVTIAGQTFTVSEGAGACGATDISRETSVSSSGLSWIWNTDKWYSQTITVTNGTRSTIPGPIYLALIGTPTHNGYPNDLFLLGNQIITRCFSPQGDYLLLVSGSLSPGQSVGLPVIWVADSAFVPVRYTPKVLSGAPSQ